MAENKSVVFRRIRGRIVPIKLTENQKDSFKGGAMVGGGVAIGVGGGFISAKLSKISEKFERASWKMENRAYEHLKSAKLFDFYSKQGVKRYRHNMRGVSRLTEKAFGFGLKSLKTRQFSSFLAGSFVAAGANKLLGHTKMKNDDTKRLAISGAAGAAAASIPFALHSGIAAQGLKGLNLVKYVIPKIFKAGKAAL
jgi:hypothetical protein